MANQVSLDISARITGYESSLSKMKQAIDQIDLGTKIGKSLQSAFQNAENYIKKLSKTPVVNIKNEQQLQNLVNSLQQAGELINIINRQIQSAPTQAFQFQGIKESREQLSKLQERLEQLQGASLSSILTDSKDLAKQLKDIGINIDKLGAAQSLKKLDEQLENTKLQAENVRESIAKTRAEIASWKPNKDDGSLFSQKSGGKGTKLLNELQASTNPFRDMDFSNGGFSPEALSAMRERLMEQIRSQFGDKFNMPEVSQKINDALMRAFDQGLSSGNIRGRVQELVQQIKTTLQLKGQDITSVFNAIFGAGVGPGKAATGLTEDLKKMTLDADTGAQRLRQIIEQINRVKSISNQGELIKLIDNGQLEEARNRIIEILNSEKQLHKENMSPPKQLSQSLTQLQQQYKTLIQQQNKLGNIKVNVQNNKGYTDQIKVIDQTVKKLQEMRQAFINAQKASEEASKTGGNIGAQQANNWALTTAQVKRYQQQLAQIQAREKMIGKLQGVVQRWFSVYAVVRMISNAIKSMISTIKELDKTITNIAIVTNMSQNDLWGQMPQYTQMAREYAASISGVYEVSQLYYQQGLQTADVMKLTEQTLKMARISGLDYAESTNYMTNALRSFKMEMEDAGRITDTYSAIAASSATSVAELAQAMSKTASSAQAVGASFENTTAMMAVMIEATRQAPENIGSAMKSIISRYGELKENPAKLVDSQGQELSLNKVDKALQSVGISIHDAQGQFREFDDVIMELAQSWDTIDTNTQRYIATVMAGNRQQSRFLALVSSYDRLKELSAIAADSENTSQLQYLKTLDSIQAKTQQLQTSMQSLYTDSGIQQTYKNWLDFANNYVKMLNSMGTGTGGLIKAISQIGMTFYSVANVVTTVFQIIRTKTQISAASTQAILTAQNNLEQALARQRVLSAEDSRRQEADAAVRAAELELQAARNRDQQEIASAKNRANQINTINAQQGGSNLGAANLVMKHRGLSVGASVGSLVLSGIAANTQSTLGQGLLGAGSTALSGLSMGAMMGHPIIGAVLGVALGLFQNIGKIWQSEADKLKELQQKASEANNKALEKQANTKSLGAQIQELRKLEAARYDSIEAEEAYYEAANKMAEQYPGLIKNLDSVGNATIDLKAAEKELNKVRNQGVKAAQEAAVAEYKAQKQAEKNARTVVEQDQPAALDEFKRYAFQNQNAADKDKLPYTYFIEREDNKQFLLSADKLLNKFYSFLDYFSISETLNIEVEENGQTFGELLENFSLDENASQLEQLLWRYIQETIAQQDKREKTLLQQQSKSKQTRRAGFARVIGAENLYKGRDYSYLNQMTSADSLLITMAEQKYTEQLGTNNNDVQQYQNFLKQQLPAFVTEVNALLQDFWTQVLNTDDARETFNKLLKETKTRTRDDMQKGLMAITGLAADDSKIANLLNSIYGIPTDDEDDPNKLRLNRMAAARDQRTQRKIRDKVGQESNNPLNLKLFQQSDEIWAKLTEYENAQILAFYDSLQKAVDNEQISKERAQGILDQYLNLAKAVQDTGNEQAEEIFYGWTDWTSTGIEALGERLTEVIGQGGKINTSDFAKKVTVNFNSIILQVENAISGILKQYEQALTQATSGMSSDKALEFAAKNGMQLSDLQFRAGKWYADSAGNLDTLYNNAIEAYNTQLAQIGDDSLVMKSLKDRPRRWLDNSAKKRYKQLKAEQKSQAQISKQIGAKIGLEGQALDVYMDWLASEDNQTFQQWIEAKRANITKMSEAEKYYYGNALLQAGHIDEFVSFIQEQDNSINDWDDIVKLYKNNNLPPALQQYKQAIQKYIEQSLTPIYDATIRLMNGDSTNESIAVNEANKKLLQQITGARNLKSGDTVQLTAQNIRKHEQEIIERIDNDLNLTLKQRQDYISKLWNSKHQNNDYETISSALNSWNNMDMSTWLALPKSLQDLVGFSSETGKGILSLTQAAQLLDSTYLTTELGMTEQEANKIRATLLKAQHNQSAGKILPDIIKNREKLSEDNIESLANLLNMSYDQVLKEIQAVDNGNGTYCIDLANIRRIMEEKGYQLTQEMQQTIADSLQDNISKAQDAVKGLSTGYTNLADMQKIMNELEDAGLGLSFDELFEFNDTLGAYVIKTEGLFRQMVVARQQLESGTEQQQRAALKLINDTGRELKKNINISALYSATSRDDLDSQVITDLTKSVNDYNTFLVANGKGAIDYTQKMNDILNGGQTGVIAAQELAKEFGQQLSNADIEAIYTKRSKALVKAAEDITAKPGAIVDDLTRQLIEMSGGAVQALGNGSYQVTKSAEDLYAAYLAIYQELSDSGTATLEELNNVTAKAFQSADKAELTSKLSGLTDLTYSALASIFTAANKEMTPALLNDLFKTGSLTALGAGKVRINDFEQFARAMGVDPTSQDYYKAFSAFNDQMINLNKRASENIKNAANNVLNAKTGDQINLTELYTHLQKDAWAAFEKEINEAGGSLNQGILSIDDTKNVEGIYQAIIKVGYEAGKLVEEDIIEAKKQLIKRGREKNNINKVIQDIVKNSQNLSQDNIQQFAKALGIDFDIAMTWFFTDLNGNLLITKESLENALEQNGVSAEDLSIETRQAIANMMSTQIEAAQGMLSNVVNNASNGFTNFSEIQKILDELNKNSAVEIQYKDIASYDRILNKWFLKTQGIVYQMQMVEQQLKQSGMSATQARRQLMAMRQQLADNIDIMSYIDSNDKDIAIADLTRSIQNFNAASQAIGYTTGISVEKLTATLEAGGLTAVQALSEFADITKQKFSSEDYLKVFNQGANKISTAIEEMNTSIGGIISEETVEILGLTNGQVQQIGTTGKYLVKQTIDLVQSYDQLLNRMILDGTATLEQINDIIAQQYEAKSVDNILASQASKGTVNMSSLKDFANRMGYKLNDLVDNMTEAGIAEFDQYTGDIKILNFDRFTAEVLKISKYDNGQLTQAYKDAYKAWNDTLINRITKDEEAIQSELSNLSNAKAGDYVNISTIWGKIGQDGQGAIADTLYKFGATINNGILYISSKAEENVLDIVMNLAEETGIKNTREGNQLIANASKIQRESSIDHLYLEILKNRDSLNEDNIRAIADTFNVTYDSVAGWLEKTKQADGTYKLSLADIEALFDNRGVQETTKEAGKKIVGSVVDNSISALSGISDKVFNFGDMHNLVEDLKTRTTATFSEKDLFEFNNELGGYVLTTQGIYAQFKMAALDAAAAEQDADEILMQQAQSLIKDIDITSVVEGLQGNNAQWTKTYREFSRSIQNYNAAMTALGEQGLNATILLDNLTRGGQQAVAAAQIIANAQGRQLSDSEVTTIFRSRVQKLMTASEELMSVGVGGVISETTADLIGYSKGSLQRLTNGGAAVLKTATDLINAYQDLYEQLVQSGAATLSELNQVMAQKLSAIFEFKNGSNKGVDYLSKAASMSYEDFSEMFAQAGVQLTDTMFKELVNSGVISEIGGGLVRVEDFKNIAKRLDIEQNSEAYTKAFKAYNDALIALDNETTDNILDEIKSVSEAKAGKKTKVNLTQLVSELDQQTQAFLTQQLKFYGGYLNNGILTIQSDANIPALIERITAISKQKGILLESQLAELADTLNEIIHTYAETIAKAISGGLSNTEASTLKAQAKNWFGIDINFTETYQGLKLSTDEANKLYQSLKTIDSAAANIVFDQLKQSLTDTHEVLQDASDVVAEITRLEEELDKPINENNKALERRLALYKEIKGAQLDSAQSYDYMGKSLPEGMQGVENYWNSTGKAFKILGQAYYNATKPLKEGQIRPDSTIGIQDFYNIVNEFNNLAKISGPIQFLGIQLDGTMQAAAEAINKGYSAITNIDGEGAVVNLTKLGIEFSGGVDSMAKGIDKGIKEMAKSQIEMLDGLIQMLETIVAMEDFKDLDTDFSGTFQFGQLFNQLGQNFFVAGNGAQTAANILQRANKQGNEDLLKGLQQTKVNGISIYEMLQDMSDGVVESEEKARLYTTALSALYSQLMSGDYDLNHLYESIMQIAKTSQAAMEINVGDQKFLVSNGIQLIWDEKAEQWRGPDGQYYGNNSEEAWSKYQAERRTQVLDTIMHGGTVANEQFEIDNNQKVVINNGTVLASKDNVFYANGKEYNDPQAAQAALQQGVKWDIQKDLDHISKWEDNGKEYASINGYLWTKIGEKWVDSQNRTYDDPKQAARAAAYEAELDWTGLDFSSFDFDKEGKVESANIDFGVGIKVSIGKDGKLQYSVRGQPCANQKEAREQAAKVAKEQLSGMVGEQSFDDVAQAAIQYGLITEINGKYQYRGKLYDNLNSIYSDLYRDIEDPNINPLQLWGEKEYTIQTKIKPEYTYGDKKFNDISDLTDEQAAQVKAALASGNKEKLSNYFQVQWASEGSIATLGEIQQLARAIGLNWDYKQMVLSASFGSSPASQAVAEIINDPTKPITAEMLLNVTATGDPAVLAAMKAQYDGKQLTEKYQTESSSSEQKQTNTEEAEQKIISLSQETFKLQQQLKDANTQLTEKEKQIGQLNKQVSQLTEQKASLQKTLDDQNATIDEKQQAINEYMTQITNLQDQCVALQNEKSQIQQQLESAQTRIAQLTEQNGQLNEANTSLQSSLNDLTTQNAALIESNAKLSEEVADLKGQLEFLGQNQQFVAQFDSTTNTLSENRGLLETNYDYSGLQRQLLTTAQKFFDGKTNSEEAINELQDIQTTVEEVAGIARQGQKLDDLAEKAEEAEMRANSAGNSSLAQNFQSLYWRAFDAKEDSSVLNQQYDRLMQQLETSEAEKKASQMRRTVATDVAKGLNEQSKAQQAAQAAERKREEDQAKQQQAYIDKAIKFLQYEEKNGSGVLSSFTQANFFTPEELIKIGQAVLQNKPSNWSIEDKSEYVIKDIQDRIGFVADYMANAEERANQRQSTMQYLTEDGDAMGTLLELLQGQESEKVGALTKQVEASYSYGAAYGATQLRAWDDFDRAVQQLLSYTVSSSNDNLNNKTIEQLLKELADDDDPRHHLTFYNPNSSGVQARPIDQPGKENTTSKEESELAEKFSETLSSLQEDVSNILNSSSDNIENLIGALKEKIQQRNNTENTNNEVETPVGVESGEATRNLEQLNNAIAASEQATASAVESNEQLAQAGQQASGEVTETAQTVNTLSGAATTANSSLEKTNSNLQSIDGSGLRASAALAGVRNGLNQLSNSKLNLSLSLEAKDKDGQPVDITSISLAGGMSSGVAAARGGQVGGKTLVGQLGPELVVSNGRYFVVGQTGAEMVSLPKDAIVFNHLQTKKLLSNERNGGRGIPVTNEKNATSFAKGTGPAAASASQALATLKQIRTMWQSMLGASMRDLGIAAGLGADDLESGGGGGGGGGGNEPEQIRAITEEIERWYNLVRQIDKLQKDISYQENLQAEIQSDRIANGQALYRSLKEEIHYLDEQIIRNQQLSDLQKSWYERKRNELAESDYGKIFTYNEEGQLQYKDGPNRGLDILQKLNERDIYGQTTGNAVNAVSQINYLRSIGFDVDKLKYNDDGTVLDASSEEYKDNPDQIYEAMMENFWNNLDGWKDQLDSIYDSYHEQLNNVLSNETKRNQLLQKIIDNQLSVEQDVLKAIESREQKLIDELQDERDALNKSAKDFIDGLNDQLNQQKQMYQNNESDKQLIKLRRQVAILQRSGGAASQIRSLQDQIAAKEQDQYFNAQQQQIAAIQKASDLQIKRMDTQIDLMTETLKYQKQNGLLWEEVYQIMNSTPEQIRQFITENTPDFQSASALDVAEKIRDIDLRINEWVGYRDDENAPAMTGDKYYDWDSYSAAREGIYGKIKDEDTRKQAKEEFDRVLNQTGDINAAGAAADAILARVLGQMTPEELEEIGEDALGELINGNNANADIVEKVKNAFARNKGVNVRGYVNQSQKGTSGKYDNYKWTFGAWEGQVTPEQKEMVKNEMGSFVQSAIVEGALNLIRRKNKIYASGGLVNYTGLAQVDGTPSRPQAFLNAQQTQLLRQHLFGSSNSLLSLAQDIVQQLHGASYSSNTINKEENSGVNIQNVDVNVNVKQISNDYDVRAIGNTVMDEMLKIARKSGTRGINRR